MKNIYKYILVVIALLAGFQMAVNADERGDKANVKLFKTTVPTGNEDEFRITLDSYVTGTKSVTEGVVPVDMILALDVSTSMGASKGDAELLTSFQELFPATPENLALLHADDYQTSGTYNIYHNYKATYDSKSGTLRYRLKDASGTEYNLAYFVNGKSYKRYNDDTLVTWNGDTGWYYCSGTNTSLRQTDSGRWQRFTGNENWTVLTDVKLDVTEKASRDFINQVYAKTNVDGNIIDHRVGIVTWAGTDSNTKPILTKALTSVKDNLSNLRSTVSLLRTAGGTDPYFGLEYAYDQFTNNRASDDSERTKVVVLFTDGQPSHNFGYTFHQAKLLKDMGVKVFTVGLFKDHTTTDPIYANSYNNDAQITVEQYLSYISSEWLGTDWKSGGISAGNKSTNPSYVAANKNTDNITYAQTTNGTNLSEIFTAIAEAAAAQTYQLGAKDAAAVDIMANDFELPEEVTETAGVTITQWFCIGTDEGNDRDFTERGIEYKVRGHYLFKNVDDATTAEAAKLHADSPSVFEVDHDTERVVVNGFDYSFDDDVTISGKTVTVNTYGNWVGIHADKQPAGKMLEFSFLVKLKPESMGGYGLPSNKPSSGIYVNTAAEGQTPVYTEGVTYYPLPVVNVPSIIIRKEGIKFGESAVFTVERTKDDAGNALEEGDEGYICYTVILSQTDPNEPECFIVIKDLAPGDYTVTENKSWSWAYPSATNFAASQTYNLHEPDLTKLTDIDTIEEFKADIASRQSAEGYGATNVATRKNEANLYYVTGALQAGNDDTAMHLLFKFKDNAETTGLLLHDEAFVVNVFGNGGGSAEFGGVDPEVVVGE